MKKVKILRPAIFAISIAFVILFLFSPLFTTSSFQVTYAAGTKVDGSDGAPVKVDGSDGAKAGSAKGSLGAEKIKNPLGDNANLDNILKKILSGINVIAAMVVTFFIILGGFKYVTAMGDEKKISEAHEMLKWTVIGAAILFGAQVIANIIQTTVTELSKVK